MTTRWLPGSLLLVLVLLTACSGSEADVVGQDTSPGLESVAEPALVDDVVSDAAAVVTPTTSTTTTSVSTTASTTTAAAPAVPTAAEVNARLGKGMNFGNSLEAPREGEWGAGLDEAYFQIIADAGFDHVRLPVSWAGYADERAPYTIPDGVDPAIVAQPYSNIWERVDWAIDQAEQNDLMIIVNMHHYDAAHEDPIAHRDRIIAMWEQIAARYADAGDHVVFELFNEPNTAFTEEPELWNDLLADLLAAVRETNPTRAVLIGPVAFNSIDYLDEMTLPDDEHLIATVHLYEPFGFTHQGAAWIDPIPPLGVRWTADSFGLPDGVFDRSWDTQSTMENGELRIEFDRQWAGFSVDYGEDVGLTEVQFNVRGPGRVRVGCQAPDDTEIDEAEIVTTTEAQDVTVDLSTCSPGATGVSIMNSAPTSEPLLFTSFTVCSDRGCESIMSSAEASLRGWVKQANDWSVRTGVPVHIGEFGAFSADGQVPMSDRAAWTATIVDEANALGMSYAYWEFHAGFGAYDLDADDWNAELRDALLG